MENLKRILRKLQDVNYISRPMQQEEEMINLSFPEKQAMQGSPVGQPQPPNPATMPLSDAAMGKMATGLERPGDMSQPSEPEAAVESPQRKKLRYLDTMQMNQKSKFPELKPVSTLAGGNRGLRI
jgi:hypothetical protein